VEEIGRILGVSRTTIYRALGRDRSAAAGDIDGAPGGLEVSVGWRLFTVLVTVAVPEAADPEDAAVLAADAAASSLLEVVQAVGWRVTCR